MRFQLLTCPVIDPVCDSESYRRFGNKGPLTTADMRWFWDQFLGAHEVRADRRIAPLATDPAGLPPAYIVTAELDPLRDEGEAFGQHLRNAGVAAQIVRGAAMVHGFARLTAHSATAAGAVAAIARALRKALG